MRKLYAFILFQFIVCVAIAQPYCNEWIKYSTASEVSLQQYLKISVWKKGIHRISYNDINQIIPAANFKSSQIQVFHNGMEQFIYVYDQNGNDSLDNSDFVEFYGEKNDGSFDTRLYSDPQHQINPYFNLFNDTAAYFLTFSDPALAGSNRRMVVDISNNFSSYNPAPYFLKESVAEFHNEYSSGFSEVSSDASYTNGEGYTSDRFGITITKSTPTPNVYPGGGVNTEVSTVFICMNANTSTWNVSVGGSSLGNAFNVGFTVTRFDNIISTTAVQSGSADFIFTPITTSGAQSNTISFVRAEYPHSLNFIGENDNVYKMKLVADVSATRTRVDFSNFNPSDPSQKWLYVFNSSASADTIHKVMVYQNGGVLQALPPTFFTNRKAVLTSEQAVITNTNFRIAPVSTDPDPAKFSRFVNYGFQDFFLNANYLMISHPLLWSEAINYRNYRNSPAGGGYYVLLADINQLYDQFAYGISKNPLAIRNFCDFAIDTFITKPKYLFLIGKSIQGVLTRSNVPNYNLNLVPTYGHPPSDQIFTSNLNDPIFHPEIATGRLSARDSNHVSMYLDKIQDHDEWLDDPNDPPQEWMKQVLHFGGGRDAGEQVQIKQHLNTYETIIEDTLFGGNVTTFLKTTTDPIQINTSQYLQDLIDTGVTIMTFFAHAGGSTFDITTDDPENYNNENKYPIIIANSCFVGDIHVPAFQYSERFIFLENKGAIGFIASPNVGYIADQAAYTIPLMHQIASYSYGEGIGICMQRGIDSVSYGSVAATKSLTMGMTLHGDPALQLYNFAKPDLFLDDPLVSFIPAEVSSDMASFDMKIIVKNLGRSVNIPYVLRITRQYPDGFTPKEFNITRNVMPFSDTVIVNIPMDFLHATGLNWFNVVADAPAPFDDAVEEWNEDNNTALVPLLIRSSDIVPVYPAKYSIVPDDSIALKASTANLFAANKPYRFEIDTTDRFNTQAKVSQVKSSPGGIVTWQLPFFLAPNKVYYWRVANDSITNPDTSVSNRFKWNESSFIHIPTKTGWSQAHYSQFKEDEYHNVVYDNNPPGNDTTFTFVQTYTQLTCHNSVIADVVSGHSVDYYLDAELQEAAGCYGTCNLVVLDSITLEPWTNKTHDLGQLVKYNAQTGFSTDCGGVAPGLPRPIKFFNYPMADLNYQNNLLSALRDSIPNGNYILFYSLPYPSYNLWQDSLRAYFDTMGSSLISLNDTPAYWQPIIFFTKKGDPSSTKEILADSTNLDIVLDTLLGGNWDKGYATSVKIGPATQWSELHWEQYPVEAGPQDSISLKVIGIDTLNVETVLIDSIPVGTPDLSLGNINASQYPYLKLKAYLEDEIVNTPPQMKRWQIYYTEVPEGALNPIRHYVHTPVTDSVQEGDNYRFEMAFENITSTPFSDSMLVDFFVYDGNNNKINVASPKYKILNGGDYLIAGASFNTTGHAGVNSMWIDVNPSNDQPEQYHFNNIASVAFKVNRDITNPILDVTFDGVHILDGDIVSPKPNILIKLKDENKFIALNDTSNFRVFLTDSTGTQTQLFFETAPGISTDPNKLKYTPAVLPNNSFTIEYSPIFIADGIYMLDVQATDEAGNLSGTYSYRISFEVINKSSITEFVNYPNPFSTSTRFVFTLTGSELPTNMKIQVMTVTGKIVREIMMNEIGNVHIGRNITQYAWDGRDEYGDLLANGVYLYRVITNINGQSIEHRETAADQFFKKGWGKMYLMR